MPSAVASALGVRIQIDDRTAEVVARAIGNRKILLLLDNCEHIVEAAARYAETMIRLCPYATILATSREVLRIDGEHVCRVPPLDVPDERVTPDDILRSSAVQLFVERTAAIGNAGHEPAVMGSIAKLVDKSLAMLDASASDGRWRLLETIRAYGLEKLRENGEAEGALRRHAEYFRALLSPAGTVSPLEPGLETVAPYGREIAKLRPSLD